MARIMIITDEIDDQELLLVAILRYLFEKVMNGFDDD